MHSSKRMQASALAASALLIVIGGSCTQPKMHCTTAHGDFAVKYELVSGDANSPCAMHTGDLVGMQTYYATGGVNGTPNWNAGSAALRPALAGDAIEEAYAWGSDRAMPPVIPGIEDLDRYTANALGDFTSGRPDADDFCEIPELTSTVMIPALPALAEELGDPMDPEDDLPAVDMKAARTIRHEWSNARWLTNPDAQGTQFEADLKITEDGCTAEYRAVGLYPAIGCATDEDCTTEGVGINPDFAVRCDTGVYGGYCVLAKDIPSYK